MISVLGGDIYYKKSGIEVRLSIYLHMWMVISLNHVLLNVLFITVTIIFFLGIIGLIFGCNAAEQSNTHIMSLVITSGHLGLYKYNSNDYRKIHVARD